MKRLLALLLSLAMLLAPGFARACTSGACISAGPRLASVSSAQGALLNALLGNLTGSNLNLSVLDWNSVATGDVSLVKTLNALQTQLGVSDTQTALNAPITLGQLSGAVSTAASAEGLTSLAVGLGDLQGQLTVPGTITLGSLIASDGIVGTTRINALSLVTGAVELFNSQNVATTTTPITIPGASLGLVGTLASVKLSAQIVEPPVYVCGPVNTQFHTSAIRVKLDMTLASLFPGTGGINILGLTISSLTIGKMPLYVEVARADGIITAVNAIANTLSVQVTPGVAALYLGSMSDAVFFNRSHILNAGTDLTPGTIGSVIVNGTTVAVLAKAAAVGSAPSPTTLSFSGAGLQTRTANSGGLFDSTLFSSLFGSLAVTLSPDILGGVIDALLLPLLSSIVDTALAPVLTTLSSTLIDPTLALVGVRLGEVDVTSGGTYMTCGLAGCVYADSNHNARQDSGELGTGATLYAKAVLSTAPTVAFAVVTVDPTTGNFSFPELNPATYTVVIGNTNSPSALVPTGPTGWIGTEAPTLSRAAVITTADLINQRFGLYHGSSVAGIVFKDDGTGGGSANNGLKDGAETVIGATSVSIVDTGGTAWDTERSDPTGAYLLWVPSAAGAVVLKVTQAADPTSVFVSGKPGTTGGAFALAGGVTSFTNIIGTAYTGVDFGDVPINRLDTDGQQSVAPGTTALYPHVFRPGSAGQLAVSVAAASPAPTGWSATAWQDTNCNGTLDAGEPALTAPIAVVASTQVCVIVKVFVPETAGIDSQLAYALTTSMAYANSTLVLAQQRTDLTVVGTSNGLRLVKTVDKSTAVSGDVITYSLTYTNLGAAGVNAVKVRDSTPAWTVFSSAACGTQPTGITACAVTAQPTVGGAGSIEFTLTGALASGASGVVSFAVKVQ